MWFCGIRWATITFRVLRTGQFLRWPTAGFSLKPVGFFDTNPVLDVPPTTHDNCACHA